MPEYRLHFLDEFGAVRRSIELDCRDDAHAREVILSHAAGAAMELWQGRRLVDRFEAENGLRG